MNAEPRATCIMPTADRRAFVPRAIAQFPTQDYPDRELLSICHERQRRSDRLKLSPMQTFSSITPCRIADSGVPL
jgi:hypothetical protein